MKRAISLTAALALMITVLFSVPVTAANNSRYTEKKLKAYLYNKTDTAEFTCLFRDDLPALPYLSAVDYLDQLYEVKFSSVKNADGTYTVSNKNGEMVIDVEKDTVHFDAFEDFVDTDAKPMLDTETADYLSDESDYEILGEGHAVDLNLGEYGIDLTASGDDVFFPLSVINHIFAGTYHGALYLEGELYFVEVLEEEPYYDNSSLYQELTRDKTIVEYSYHELCFVMDYFYGCPPNSRLAKDIREKGFDRTLEEYDETTAKAKELLLSEDLLDYCFGLMYLDMYLDDGGHTVMSAGLNADATTPIMRELTRAFTNWLGDERVRTVYDYFVDASNDYSVRDDLEDERDSALSGMTQVKKWDDAAFYVTGDMGVFTFDEFKDAVVEPFKWSLDYAAENGIKSFVVDLSLNVGGSTAVVCYMMSVMCNDMRSDYDNKLTGNRFYTSAVVDKNLDGEFDEADDLVSYDMQFAVLTTRFSFSCANLLPCMLKDDGVPVIGETSGGGTCAVTLHYDPVGYCYAVSDSLMMTHHDGSDLDSGASPDIPMPGRSARYKEFYNFDQMAQEIDAFYAAHPKPASPTHNPDDADSDDSGDISLPVDLETVTPYLWIAGGALALICAAVFVIVLIDSARSNRKNRRYY